MLRHSPIAVLLLGSLLCAQGGGLSAEWSANPAPLGQTVTLTVKEAQGVGVSLPSSCVFTEVRAGSPTGPTVTGYFCLTIITPIGPGQTRSMTWDQRDNAGNQVAPGVYWFRVGYFGAGPGLSVQWFCLTVEANSTDARLDTVVAPQVNNVALYSITAPNAPGFAYACAASFSTDAGIGGVACIDQDALFDLSFPSPLGSVFTNFQGFTDASGQAGGIGIIIPNYPFLADKPIHVQGIVFGGGQIEVTNVRSHWILP